MSCRDRHAIRARRILPRLSCIGSSAAMVIAWPLVAGASPAAHDGAAGDHAGQAVNSISEIQWITPIFGNSGNLGMLWALINFGVLLWLLNKLLFTPLRQRTAAKHDGVKAEIDKATASHEQALSILEEYKERIARLDAEVEELMADAKTKAQADRARIIKAAEREAEQIKATARATAEREANVRRQQLESEIVDRAVERAEAMIRQKITSTDRSAMVDRYVEQLGQVELGGR